MVLWQSVGRLSVAVLHVTFHHFVAVIHHAAHLLHHARHAMISGSVVCAMVIANFDIV
jgi:hypothetical protein